MRVFDTTGSLQTGVGTPSGGFTGAMLVRDLVDPVGAIWSNTVRPENASSVGVVVKGQAAQTADLLQLQNSAAVVLFALSAAGKVSRYANSAVTDGQLLIGHTTNGTFEIAVLTGTANQITVTNGAGAVTVSLPSAVTVATSVTVPTVYGGSAAGSILNLTSTSNGTPSGDQVKCVVNGGDTFSRIRFNAGVGPEAFVLGPGICIGGYYDTRTSPTPTQIGAFTFSANDSADAEHRYAQMKVRSLTVTAGATDGTFEFLVRVSGTDTLQIAFAAGVVLGVPTGSFKGTGSLNVAGDIYRNNTAYNNPKWVLKRWAVGSNDVEGEYAAPEGYEGPHPLSWVEEYCRGHYDLPLMGFWPNGGLAQRGDLVLASVEEAYLYLFDHESRLRRLEESAVDLSSKK